MTNNNRSSRHEWTSKQALVLMTFSLLGGIAGGYVLRGDQPARTNAPASTTVTATRSSQTGETSPADLKKAADQQAIPLQAKLKEDPANPDLLTNLGNLYYDAQQYDTAVDYYARSLKARPSDASVRTDMATAYWYMGNADLAISEFNKALTYAPNNSNTLFNLGLVKWRGKHDGQGAIAEWKKLLAVDPNYEERSRVLQMLAEAQQQAPAKPAI